MSRELIFHESVKLQLNQIRDYIDLKSGYANGEKFIFELEKTLTDLCIFPNVGSEVDNYSRKLVFNKKYNIYYEFDDDFLQILDFVNVKKK